MSVVLTDFKDQTNIL